MTNDHFPGPAPSPAGDQKPSEAIANSSVARGFHLNLSSLAVRETAVTWFLFITIVIAGVYAFLALGRAEIRRSR